MTRRLGAHWRPPASNSPMEWRRSGVRLRKSQKHGKRKKYNLSLRSVRPFQGRNSPASSTTPELGTSAMPLMRTQPSPGLDQFACTRNWVYHLASTRHIRLRHANGLRWGRCTRALADDDDRFLAALRSGSSPVAVLEADDGKVMIERVCEPNSRAPRGCPLDVVGREESFAAPG